MGATPHPRPLSPEGRGEKKQPLPQGERGEKGSWTHQMDLLADLTPAQREAVTHVDGPLLILAGPGSGKTRVYVEAGGLMSYGPNLPDVWKRAAVYVDKILKGARPGDLPVEQPTTFELTLNNRTSKAMGLTIPPSLVLSADHIVE